MLVNLNKGELDGHRILEAESYELLWTPSVKISKDGEKTLLPTGLSWFLGEHDGHRTVAHGGGDRGFRSYILLLPDADIGVVVASNWSRTKVSDIVRGVLDIVLADDQASVSQ
jgi:CubicO group peptidase (beta-lactamase class C family)